MKAELIEYATAAALYALAAGTTTRYSPASEALAAECAECARRLGTQAGPLMHYAWRTAQVMWSALTTSE